MKIGLFSNTYSPLLNGVATSIQQIRRGLEQAGHQPYVFAPDVRGYQDETSDVFRFKSVEMTKKIDYPIPIPYSNKLFRLINETDFDVIHAHHPFLLGDVAARFAKKKRVPLIYTFHTQMEQYSHYVPFQQDLVRGMVRNSCTRFLSKCDLVIAPSENICGLLDSYGVTARVVTLANAIDTSTFHPQPHRRQACRQALNLPAQATITLSVGRLAQEKNLDFMIRSFAALPQCDDHHLLIIGDGHEEGALKALAAHLGVSSRIHFFGTLSHEDIPMAYTASDLFAICSTTEVKPLVVLEALASGLPVLAVAACGTADTLHHHLDGWLTEPTEKAFKHGWATLLNDSELRLSLSAAAPQTAAQYSFDLYLERLIRLYEECILASSRTPSPTLACH